MCLPFWPMPPRPGCRCLSGGPAPTTLKLVQRLLPHRPGVLARPRLAGTRREYLAQACRAVPVAHRSKGLVGLLMNVQPGHVQPTWG